VKSVQWAVGDGQKAETTGQKAETTGQKASSGQWQMKNDK
jgi:hypothetical protein